MTANAASEPRQLVLDLPHRQALGAEDFLVSRSNAAAVEIVDQWPDWSTPAILVSGPAGSGKSHLVNVWRKRSGAARVRARDLDEGAIAEFERAGSLAIEDVSAGVGSERVMFHLINLARERGASLLVTSRAEPGQIEIALPDLRSRLRAMPLVRLAEPDEGLLRGVLVKLFADRQLSVDPTVIEYLVRHVERSMEAVTRAVAEIDRLSLAEKRKVSRQIAAQAIDRMGGEGS